jgi:hypothetical protein
MPSSILEDSSNLSPAGKVVCSLTFAAGLGGLMLWVGVARDQVEAIRAEVLEERAEFITASKPEEMASVLPPVVKPKTANEGVERRGVLNDLLNQLREDAAKSPLQEYRELAKAGNAMGLVRFGVLEGLIHPLEAPLIIDEINVLKKMEATP